MVWAVSASVWGPVTTGAPARFSTVFGSALFQRAVAGGGGRPLCASKRVTMLRRAWCNTLIHDIAFFWCKATQAVTHCSS